MAISGFPEAEKRGLDYAKVLKDFEKKFKDKTTFQKFADTLHYDYQNESYAIFSCSLKWNNILMWSHYANHHTGFCVGLRADKMIDSHLFGKLGEVAYKSKYPQIKPRVARKDKQMMINSFLETHTKAKNWKYEAEYRFMSNHFPEKLSLEDRLITIPNNFFAEVILGINISEKDKMDIKQICDQKNIPVYQAKKKDFKFKIKKIKYK